MSPDIAMRKESFTVKTFVYIFLVAGVFTMALPYVWMLITSFKPLAEIQAFPPTFTIKNPTLEPYKELFRMIPMMR